MVVWFECEMTHMGLCVETLGPQMVAPSQMAVEPLEGRSLWQKVSHWGHAGLVVDSMTLL